MYHDEIYRDVQGILADLMKADPLCSSISVAAALAI